MEHSCGQEYRFDKMETAITEIKDALKTITDLLIKQATQQTEIDHMKAQLAHLETQVSNMAPYVNENHGFITRAERFIWMLLTAAVGVLAYYFKRS